MELVLLIVDEANANTRLQLAADFRPSDIVEQQILMDEKVIERRPMPDSLKAELATIGARLDSAYLAYTDSLIGSKSNRIQAMFSLLMNLLGMVHAEKRAALPILLGYTEAPDPLRVEAAKVLGQLNLRSLGMPALMQQSVQRRLMNAYESAYTWNRSNAASKFCAACAKSLGAIGDKRALNWLMQRCLRSNRTGQSDTVLTGVVKGLYQMAERFCKNENGEFDDARVLPIIQTLYYGFLAPHDPEDSHFRALSSKPLNAMAEAAESLGKLGTPTALACLLNVSQMKPQSVIAAADEAAKKIILNSLPQASVAGIGISPQALMRASTDLGERTRQAALHMGCLKRDLIPPKGRFAGRPVGHNRRVMASLQ
jgi:hypothetical protein